MTQEFRGLLYPYVPVPANLIDDIVNEECVLFLGAGASTEGQGTSYWRQLLVDELTAKCKPPRRISKRLPDVAQYYCEKMDAGNKGKLCRIILERIRRFMSTPAAFRSVTICHSIIASIPQFKIIVTTNWDQFMERAMNVVPIVARARTDDKDMAAYWDDHYRQVIKMHGCITDPSSIVATSKDYDNYMRDVDKSLIWNKIRDLMTTKTFLFLGYGLRDPSFIRMYSDISNRTKSFARPSYVVTPNITRKEAAKWRRKHVTVVRGLAYPFLENVREALIERDILFDVRSEIPRIENELEGTALADSKLRSTLVSTTLETEVGIATSLYIRGLGHGLEQLVHELKHGTTRARVEDDLIKTRQSLRRLRRSRIEFRDSEISYWSGRVQSLEWFLSKGRRRLDKHFSARYLRPVGESEFENELRAECKPQKDAHRYSKVQL